MNWKHIVMFGWVTILIAVGLLMGNVAQGLLLVGCLLVGYFIGRIAKERRISRRQLTHA